LDKAEAYHHPLACQCSNRHDQIADVEIINDQIAIIAIEQVADIYS